jgi:alpha-L-rhamnosidase
MEKAAAGRLAADVRSFGHLTTGFLGTPHILHILTRYGYLDEAYMLLYRTEYPSWLYMVTKGATTIWERWDGIKPDGTFSYSLMNSFALPDLGAAGNWLYRVVAGINPDPETTGFRHIIIKPHPGNEMNDVSSTHESMYGTIRSEWQIKRNVFTLRVSIPVNSTAEVFIPSTGNTLTMNGKSIESKEAPRVEGINYHFLQTRVGSGDYVFETEFGLQVN